MQVANLAGLDVAKLPLGSAPSFMQQVWNTGRLVKWNDERGFGFVVPEGADPGREVFVHISAIRPCGRRPRIGDQLQFTTSEAADGRVRVGQAQLVGVSLGVGEVARPRAHPASRHPRRSARSAAGSWRQRAGLVVLAGALLALGMRFCSRTRPGIVESIAQPDCLVKGNVSMNSGMKLYHVPGMEDYVNTRIDPEKEERWFCTEQEALSAGWVRAPS